MIAVIFYKFITTQEPSYLADISTFHAQSRHLHSSNRNLLQKDRTNLVFTDRSFSQAAPIAWNNLPQHAISDRSSLTAFKCLLKTTLQTIILLLIRDVTRTCDSLLCELLIVRHQPYNDDNDDDDDHNNNNNNNNNNEDFVGFHAKYSTKLPWHSTIYS